METLSSSHTLQLWVLQTLSPQRKAVRRPYVYYSHSALMCFVFFVFFFFRSFVASLHSGMTQLDPTLRTDMLFNNLFVLHNKKIKIYGKNVFLFQISPLWHPRKYHWLDLMYIKNEANWLAAMLSKELWLVQIQNSKNLKKTWIERCRHLRVCPLIDHGREPITMRE